jgi:sugar phosphate permease
MVLEIAQIEIKPGMEAELGFNKAQIGMILGSLKIAYAVGQLINGQLAERFSPRVLLAIGMLLLAGVAAFARRKDHVLP